MASFKDHIKINKEKISDEMRKQSELLYEVGVKVETLAEQVQLAESKLKRVETSLANELRTKYRRVKEQITDTEIRNLAKLNKDYIELENELIKLQKVYRLAKLRKEVIKTKGEMMINIGHHVREENKQRSSMR